MPTARTDQTTLHMMRTARAISVSLAEGQVCLRVLTAAVCLKVLSVMGLSMNIAMAMMKQKIFAHSHVLGHLGIQSRGDMKQLGCAATGKK